MLIIAIISENIVEINRFWYGIHEYSKVNVSKIKFFNHNH